MRIKSLLITSLWGTALALGAAGCVGQSERTPASSVGPTPKPVAGDPATAPVPGSTPLVPDYRAIVKRYGPAVVGVSVSGTLPATGDADGLPPELRDDPFFRFFRGLPGFQFHGPGGAPQPFRGQGSGFIIGSDGLILTNAHVVHNAKQVTVHLNDRREFTAKVLGLDAPTDIAVLRIDATGLPTVRLGDSDDLEVGDPVLAIGAPYGFEESATRGIVSAKRRSLPGDAAVPFIQTDAAVNPGNSGGPLFDGNGAVVGINAQIYSRSGGFQGLSFAIPINVALRVKDQIVATGKATHAQLGVTIQEMNQGLADSFGMKRPDGALITRVTPGSAAAAAGLRPGDVITEVDDTPIVRSIDLSSLVGATAPGTKVRLKVWRDRSEHEIVATLGAESTTTANAASAGAGGNADTFGLALQPLTAQERRDAGIEHGLRVEATSGPAAQAGVQAGDLLLAVNGQAVDRVDQVRRALASKPKSVALLIKRGGETIFVAVSGG